MNAWSGSICLALFALSAQAQVPRDYTGPCAVRTPRAYFHDEAQKQGKAYVIQGDTVEVLGAGPSDDFVRGRFQAKKATEGLLRRDALACWKPEDVKPADLSSTDATLSALEPLGAQCAWVKVEPRQGKRAVLARMEGRCDGGRVALSKDQARALILFEQESGAVTLHQVDVKAGRAEKVTPPPLGTVRSVGFDDKGRALALTVENVEDGQPLQVEGKPVKPCEACEGLPALAHAFALGPKGWERVESVATGVESDLAPGEKELSLYTSLRLDSQEQLSPHPDAEAEGDAKVLKALARLFPKAPVGDDAEWNRLKGTAAPVWVYLSLGGEAMYSTGALALGGKKGPESVVPGFTSSDAVAPLVRGPYLLVVRAYIGSEAVMLDVKKGELLPLSRQLQAVTFWPRP
jgi:hypothetical protein